MLTTGGERPSRRSAVVAINSGLVAFPTSFELVRIVHLGGTSAEAGGAEGAGEEPAALLALWRPVPPSEQYSSLGLVATAFERIQPSTDVPPSLLSDSGALRSPSVFGAPPPIVLSPDPPPLSSVGCVHKSALVAASLGACLFLPGQPPLRAWAVLNSSCTFEVCAAGGWRALDLRSPLGVPPAALTPEAELLEESRALLQQRTARLAAEAAAAAQQQQHQAAASPPLLTRAPSARAAAASSPPSATSARLSSSPSLRLSSLPSLRRTSPTAEQQQLEARVGTSGSSPAAQAAASRAAQASLAHAPPPLSLVAQQRFLAHRGRLISQVGVEIASLSALFFTLLLVS